MCARLPSKECSYKIHLRHPQTISSRQFMLVDSCVGCHSPQCPTVAISSTTDAHKAPSQAKVTAPLVAENLWQVLAMDKVYQCLQELYMYYHYID